MSAVARRAPRALRIVRRFAAPAARVFDAWLDPALARRWLFATAGRPLAHAEIEARAQGRFRLTEQRDADLVVHAGRYVEIARPRRLAFTLALDGDAGVETRVTVDVAPAAGGCRVAVTHDGVPRERAAHASGRWVGMLYGLAALLDAATVTASAAAAERRRARPVSTPTPNGGTLCNTY